MITSVAFSADGKKLMSTGEDRFARLWQVATGKELLKIAHGEDTFGGVSLSPDGKLAAGLSAWQDGKFYLWDLQSGKELLRVAKGHKRINQVAFSPNGKMVAASDVSGKISLYEVTTGKLRASFSGHFGEIASVAFSPDGLRLATGSADTTVLVWDVTAGGKDHPPGKPAIAEIFLQKHWQALGNEDAALAYQAMWRLAACPELAEPFLLAQLKPVPDITPQQIKDLITNLDDASFARRTQAMSQLVELGKKAESILKATLQQPISEEVRQRILGLLDKLHALEFSVEQVRTQRALETLEWIGTKNSLPSQHAELNGK
jgi:hypothetical protein